MFFTYLECQIDLPWDDKHQIETIVLAPRAQFDIEITRYYTGMPTLDSFATFVENLEPKAKDLISWNGKYNKETCNIDCHFARSKILDFTIAN